MRMSRKRILSFALLFGILVTSLFYVLPTVTNPLRIDDVSADAYVVPWMRPNPSIDVVKSLRSWNIDAVMTAALKLNITFNIAIPRFNQTRMVPSTIYLGHDKNYLYVGGRFVGMGQNPASTSSTVLYSYLNVYFDVDNDGVLTSPESGSSLEVGVGPEVALRNETDSWRSYLIWSYDDLVWSRSTVRPGQDVWLTGEKYYSPTAQPSFALGEMDTLYDQSTETLMVLFSRFLSRPALSEIDALQMKFGERWVMGFLIELGYNTWYGTYTDFVDGWPQKIYPYLSSDSSWWPKLVIDLTNPPANM